jgi:hypothetical protein
MEFVKIIGHDRYEISKCGVIRNILTKKIKSQYIGSTGYYMVSFSYNNKSKPQRVHRLLASTFLKNIHNAKFINHIDGNKLNNDLNNLEWCTHSHNMKHAFETGLVNNTGEKNGMSKLNLDKVTIIKKLLKDGISQQKIANIFNVSRSAILKIHLGKTWNHI